MTDPAAAPDPEAFGLDPARPERPTTCGLDCDGKFYARIEWNGAPVPMCYKHYQRTRRTGDPHTVRDRGRKPVGGAPTRIIPATKTRSWREATVHRGVRLGARQHDRITSTAKQQGKSGNAVIRDAVARLLDGSIPAPTPSSTIPAPLPANEGTWPSWVPADGQVAALNKLADAMPWLVDPARPGRPTPQADARNALIRYALDQHLPAPDNGPET